MTLNPKDLKQSLFLLFLFQPSDTFWTNQYVNYLLCATVSILAKRLNLSQNGKCFIGYLEKSPWTCDDFALWGNLIQLGYWKIWHITLYYHSFVFADFTNVSRVTTFAVKQTSHISKLKTILFPHVPSQRGHRKKSLWTNVTVWGQSVGLWSQAPMQFQILHAF